MESKTNRAMLIFMFLVVFLAGIAFSFKVFEFVYTSNQSPAADFIMPVLTYLVVASGFFCLFLWAYLSGQFKDIEAPKYRMLELDRIFDEQERERKRNAKR